MTASLREAYLGVYVPQDLSEEEILANYFYSEGLDDEDLEILIDEYGDDFFLEWSEDVLDYQFELDEARKSGKIEPLTKSGKNVGSLKGGARSAAINRLKREKAERKAKEEKASSEKPSGLTSALKSQADTVAKAKETKGKMKGRIGQYLDRAKSDIELVKNTAKTAHNVWKKGVEGLNTASDSRLARQARFATKKAAKTIGKSGESVGKKVGGHLGRAAANSWVGDTFKAGQKLRKALSNSYEPEVLELIEYLVDEGYVDSAESAENMLNFMSEEWVEEILLERDRHPGETDGSFDKYKPQASQNPNRPKRRLEYDDRSNSNPYSGENPTPRNRRRDMNPTRRGKRPNS